MIVQPKITRFEWLIIVLPSVLLLVCGLLCALFEYTWHRYGSFTGGVFCGGSGILTFWLCVRYTNDSPVIGFATVSLGFLIRAVVGLGGGVLVFTALDGWSASRNQKLAYFAWLLAAYIGTLMVELFLLARRFRVRSESTSVTS